MTEIMELHSRKVFFLQFQSSDKVSELMGKAVRLLGLTIFGACRTPSLKSLSACSRFQRRNSLFANLGKGTALAFSVLVDLNLIPAFVCSRLSTTRTMPIPKSRFFHLRASISPLRIPVARAKRGGQ
jgi:hypothetical protein